jgi:hypothetical protein
MTQVAMHPALAQALQQWRCESSYSKDSDWVFASARAKGKIPRSAGVAGQDYLRPAATGGGQGWRDSEGVYGKIRLAQSQALDGVSQASQIETSREVTEQTRQN